MSQFKSLAVVCGIHKSEAEQTFKSLDKIPRSLHQSAHLLSTSELYNDNTYFQQVTISTFADARTCTAVRRALQNSRGTW